MSGKYDIDRDLTIRRLTAEIARLKEKLQDPPGESQEPTATEEEQALPEYYRPPYG